MRYGQQWATATRPNWRRMISTSFDLAFKHAAGKQVMSARACLTDGHRGAQRLQGRAARHEVIGLCTPTIAQRFPISKLRPPMTFRAENHGHFAAGYSRCMRFLPSQAVLAIAQRLSASVATATSIADKVVGLDDGDTQGRSQKAMWQGLFRHRTQRLLLVCSDERQFGGR